MKIEELKVGDTLYVKRRVPVERYSYGYRRIQGFDFFIPVVIDRETRTLWCSGKDYRFKKDNLCGYQNSPSAYIEGEDARFNKNHGVPEIVKNQIKEFKEFRDCMSEYWDSIEELKNFSLDGRNNIKEVIAISRELKSTIKSLKSIAK